MSKFRAKLKIKPFTIKNVLKCMENLLENFLYLIFQTDVTIGCKFDVHQSCRAPRGLSYRWRPFLNPSSELREKLKLKSFTIRIVLECMGKIS